MPIRFFFLTIICQAAQMEKESSEEILDLSQIQMEKENYQEVQNHMNEVEKEKLENSQEVQIKKEKSQEIQIKIPKKIAPDFLTKEMMKTIDDAMQHYDGDIKEVVTDVTNIFKLSEPQAESLRNYLDFGVGLYLGQKVFFRSFARPILVAKVKTFNKDGTIDLDVKKRAKLSSISTQMPEGFTEVWDIDVHKMRSIHVLAPKSKRVFINYRHDMMQKLKKAGVPDLLIKAACKQQGGTLTRQFELRTLDHHKAEITEHKFFQHLLERNWKMSFRLLKRTLDTKSGYYKKGALEIFVHQALNMTEVDDGRCLAGLIYLLWNIKYSSLNKKNNPMRSLLERGVYKQGRSSKWCWRQWIQEALLHRPNNHKRTKEIVKSLLEKTTGIKRNSKEGMSEGHLMTALHKQV